MKATLMEYCGRLISRGTLFFKPVERRLLALMLVFSLALRLFYVWKPLEKLLEQGIADDAFYYFGIARNLARGLGPSFDGLHLTNGFHPLYTALITPIFYLIPQNNDLAVRLSLALLMLCAVLAAVPLYAALSRIAGRPAGLFAALLWLFNPYALIFTLGGVETAVYMLCAALSIWLYARILRSPEAGVRHWLGLGACLGLTLLARSDGIFLLGALLADLGLELLLPADPARRPTVAETITKGALLVGACLLVFSPWMLWSQVTFGSPLQVSGQAVHWHTHAGVPPGAAYIEKLQESLVRMLFGALLFCNQVLIPAAALLGVKLVRRKAAHRVPVKPGHPAAHRLVRVALFYSIFLVGGYGIYLWQQQFWYFAPLMLMSALLGGLAFGYLGELLAARRMRFSKVLLALTAAGVLLLGGRTWWDWQRGALQVYPAQRGAVALADYLSSQVEPGSVTGAWNSGILGFLADNRVANLDGVVNNEIYAFARERGVSMFDLCGLWDYIQAEGIDYLTDYEDIWSPQIETLFAGRLSLQAELPAGGYEIRVYRVLPGEAPQPSCPAALKVVK